MNSATRLPGFICSGLIRNRSGSVLLLGKSGAFEPPGAADPPVPDTTAVETAVREDTGLSVHAKAQPLLYAPLRRNGTGRVVIYDCGTVLDAVKITVPRKQLLHGPVPLLTARWVTPCEFDRWCLRPVARRVRIALQAALTGQSIDLVNYPLPEAA